MAEKMTLVLNMPERDEIGWILERDGSIANLDILGTPLVVYNINKFRTAKREIECVIVPEGHHTIISMIGNYLPDIEIKEYGKLKPELKDGDLAIPVNSVVSLDGEIFTARELVYPWDILSAMSEILTKEVLTSVISPKAVISETAVISGPCIISDGVVIDDFCKIKGPVYIGPRTRIGTGSLIRQSMIGEDSVIGFSCEIAKSYFAGQDNMAHLDVVLDSVLGKNVWSGAFLGTTNVLLNKKSVKYKMGDEMRETGLNHFGAIIGHDASIGAATITLPGRFIPPETTVPPGTVFTGRPDPTK